MVKQGNYPTFAERDSPLVILPYSWGKKSIYACDGNITNFILKYDSHKCTKQLTLKHKNKLKKLTANPMAKSWSVYVHNYFQTLYLGKEVSHMIRRLP